MLFCKVFGFAAALCLIFAIIYGVAYLSVPEADRKVAPAPIVATHTGGWSFEFTQQGAISDRGKFGPYDYLTTCERIRSEVAHDYAAMASSFGAKTADGLVAGVSLSECH